MMRVFSRIEMWCRRQAAAAILPLLLAGWLTGESSEALTTFGKSVTAPPKEVSTPPPARPCARQAECAGTSSSSCVRTHYDSVTRCLCGDNSPPLNGQCVDHPKSLYHVCADSGECNDGLVCLSPNVTGSSPPHLRVHTNQEKICFCDTETGFKEKDYACSDADILKTSIFAIVFVTCIRKMFLH